MRSCGLTLIETLAVIVIIAMVSAVGAVGLSQTSDAARLHATASRFEAFEMRARTLARREGSLIVSAGRTLAAYEPGRAEPVLMLALQRASVRFSDPETGQDIDQITIDGAGRSIDYNAEVRVADLRRTLQIRGLTGLLVVDRNGGDQ